MVRAVKAQAYLRSRLFDMLSAKDVISIGTLARRTGVAVSALRFYEERGLLHPGRNRGGQRRFLRADIRRVSFILIAQRLGLSLDQIATALAGLPQARTPNAQDWQQISQSLLARLDDQMAALSRTRERLAGCIGCGCLSLSHCALYNPQDEAGAHGPGARFIVDATSSPRG
jgi:MerR family transcriptional regulator, redox-sensitive transcriptional activator SoxR